ncbi:MAG: ATP-binding cassette domain-containing protein [Spirochaetaceae bacterium]|nr:MAG: ATP-binding cassette domain-containing protein [Spirochaetaceae bacterium]
MIDVQDVCKSYGKLRAVDQVSFSLSSQRVTGLLGPNGAGKTTLMRLLTGYLYPDAGVVLIDGIDIAVHPAQARAKIGYVPENAPLYPELTPYELLEFVLAARARSAAALGQSTIRKQTGRRLLRRHGQREHIESVIEKVGISEVKSRTIGSLSRGYKQRVAVGAALIASPQVLVLDEPTSALDPNQTHEMRQLIRELGHDATVLVSSHVLSEIEAVCSDAVILHRGRVVGRGDIASLRRELSAGIGERIRVAFDPEYNDDILVALRSTPGIAELEPELNTGALLVRLQPNAEGPQVLFDFAAKQGLKLKRLEPLEGGLEEVFRVLTAEEVLP